MVSTLLSQTVIHVLFTWLVLTRPQEVTQEEVDLWMKFGDEQAEQMKVGGEPIDVV